jgi:predicted nucleic acid-binding protein
VPELADTSAWLWSRRVAELRADFDDRVMELEIVTCEMVKLELLTEARNGKEFDRRREQLDALPQRSMGEAEWLRALEVYGRLAHQGGAHQRSVKHADLLIAAAAERGDVPVLHYDEDFDRIAAVTGQPTRRLARRGSL